MKFISIIPIPILVFFVNIIIKVFLVKKLQKEERLDGLNGSTIKIKLEDKVEIFLSIQNRNIICQNQIIDSPDVTLTGNVIDFINLMLKKEDADSLFFSRKLAIEGNIEKSVLFKNILANI